MTEKEIGKINLGKYTEDSKKSLILEVDVEYPEELHDMHNDYPLAAENINIKKDKSNYCETIRQIQNHNWTS